MIFHTLIKTNKIQCWLRVASKNPYIFHCIGGTAISIYIHIYPLTHTHKPINVKPKFLKFFFNDDLAMISCLFYSQFSTIFEWFYKNFCLHSQWTNHRPNGYKLDWNSQQYTRIYVYLCRKLCDLFMDRWIIDVIQVT